MANEKIVYELAFHLNPDLEETQVRQLAQDIENYITSAGGVISFKKEPERARLSYPIKHKRQAHFGYIHFTLESPEGGLAVIDEQVRRNNDVLRYLTIKVPTEPAKAKFRFKPQKPRTAEKPAERQTPAESKELEKQLEGVLENL